MRLAYVCADPGVPVFGSKGCSIHVQEVLRALIRNGARLTLFARSIGGEAPPGLEDVDLRRLPDLPRGETSHRQDRGRSSNAALCALLEEGGPFDLVYERYSLWSFAAMEYAARSGVPGLLEVNAPLIDEQIRYRSLADPRAARNVEKRVFNSARALVAVSRGVAAYAARYPGVERKTHVIPNGVDPARFAAGLKPSHPARPGMFTVGFVGTLKPWHGLPTLATAFARVCQERSDLRLLIVGDGPIKERLARIFAAFQVTDHVLWTGAVPPAQIPALLASMDAAVAPYPELPHFYFSPLKVYEYMAARLPIVVSRTGQLADLIKDDVNGLLFPPGDSEALSRALEKLQAAPPLRMRLGLEARATVEQNHTWDRIARRILQAAEIGRPVHRQSNTHHLIGN